MKEISVNSNNKVYKVYMDNDINKIFLAFEENKVRKNGKIFIITDDNVYSIYEEKIKKLVKNLNYNIFIMQHGEENKSYNTISKIYEFLLQNECDRKDLLVAFGGGIVGDITGYVAATYMRGLKYVSVPTTLISQVDSSVGGKVAYNFNNVKNLIGTFYDPSFVFISVSFLKTLSKREFINGMGEVMKYCIIKDANLFKYIKTNMKAILELENDKLIYIVKECIKIKADVVERDYNDLGYRNILNFGHTIGHAIEIDSNYEVSHGEAVSLGTLAAIKLSEMKFFIDSNIYKEIKKMYSKLGMKINYDIVDKDKFLKTIKHDKKIENNKIKFTLLEDIENCQTKVDITEDEIEKAISESIGRNL